MKPITESEALSMLATTFGEPVDTVQPNAQRANIAGWDSMGALMLMAELDERFSIELTAENSKQMQCVADVLNFLRQHGALQS